MLASSPFPPELLVPPPRDPRSTAGLRLTPPPQLGSQVAGLMLVPVVLVGWAIARDGMSADLLPSGLIGLGLDALLLLFVLGFSVQRRRATRIYREGVATTGWVRQTSSSADRSGDVHAGLLEVDYEDGTGERHVGRFSALGPTGDMDVSPGAPVAMLFLPARPRVCAVYTKRLGIVPGRAPR